MCTLRKECYTRRVIAKKLVVSNNGVHFRKKPKVTATKREQEEEEELIMSVSANKYITGTSKQEQSKTSSEMKDRINGANGDKALS